MLAQPWMMRAWLGFPTPTPLHSPVEAPSLPPCLQLLQLRLA